MYLAVCLYVGLVCSQGRDVVMRVLLDSASPMQKRIAAYLVLMKDPKPTELTQLATLLPREEDQQVRSFMVSHIVNILSSTEPETAEYVKNSCSCISFSRHQLFHCPV